jgi:hypothetical protein
VLAGLGLVGFFAFGVTLEAINDPQQLTAIPFSPWDFVTYGLMTLAMMALIRLVRRPDQRKRLDGPGLRGLHSKAAVYGPSYAWLPTVAPSSTLLSLKEPVAASFQRTPAGSSSITRPSISGTPRQLPGKFSSLIAGV